MYEVKRVAAIIKPTEKMLSWVKKASPANHHMKLSTLRRDCTTLLLPAFKGPEQAKSFIQEIYTGIFENELASWGLRSPQWPEDRTYDLFNEWFEIEYHSMIYDIGDLAHPIQ